ncbi:protein NUCLEAR FUSION DEFECTIVE 4-like [Andrographis paniculata]|uniref:protein NUCLEAR FUSION DEFECTIVE 4-like n=1 Tax=Andrographis paniculata TaxID=175694 RepID=UPI0021E7DFC9|nr:protein NUCLEAR FUSION DEFECTIVE 4-like [Andrographis paniculata]
MGLASAKLSLLLSNRWLVFVAAMWLQSCAGIGYLFGSISPTIKTNLNYNQRQLASLGVAKDLGDSFGIFSGGIGDFLPLWGVLLVGALKNFIGYGWVWLVVTGRVPVLPLWAMCILIFVGTNGETYFNTVSLVSCVQNFPKSRGPVVGILKGFAGLSGAILSQIYTLIHSPDHASLLFMVAVGPSMVAIALMFVIRPVGGHKQLLSSDNFNFSVVYSICLVLAAYLMGVMVVQDLVAVSHTITIVFTVILLILLLLPILIPINLVAAAPSEPKSLEEEALVPPNNEQQQRQQQQESSTALGGYESQEIIFSEVEEEKPKEVDMLPASERHKRIAQLQSRLAQAAAEGAVRIKRRRRPHRGEDFTMMEALIKADFWLIFFSLMLGSGSGLTVIDNLGQMSESLGYENTHVFVSLISIFNFLGRVGGGFLSEKIVSDYAYPRHLAMAVAQLVMAVGHFFFAMGWPGAMYVGTLLVGIGYGSHWAIVPAAVSELFGLKKFGGLYNVITIANPAGSLIFSGVIASTIYDREAEKQAGGGGSSLLSSFIRVEEPLKCHGTVCYFMSSLILCGICIVASILSMILVYRTKTVYAHLYGRSPAAAAAGAGGR